MIVIRLQGGLGNQMFQYALYRELLHLGRAVKIDDESGYREDRQRHPALTEAFGAHYERASAREVRTMRDAFMDPVSRVRRKLFGRRNREWEEPDGRFYPEVLDRDGVYLNGYFQSACYFPDEAVRKELRRAFLGRGEAVTEAGSAADDGGVADALLAGSDAHTLAERIAADGDRSVSLHIRRGDYLLPGVSDTHGGICTEGYYGRAIDAADAEIDGAVYYIFSDDVDYARMFAKQQAQRVANAGGISAEAPAERFVVAQLTDVRGAKKDAAELLLISRCRHHILANSSFSWWGAWLGMRGGIALAPDRWFNNRAADAVYTEEMRRIAAG